MKRRHVLLAAVGVPAALVVGWAILPPRSRLGSPELLGRKKGEGFALNGWVRIGADGTVVLAMPRAEMGQGVFTALSMLVAEELDVPLAQVALAQAPIDAIYGNVAALTGGLPFHPDDDGSALARGAGWFAAKAGRELGLQITGGSASVRDAWLPVREAAAAARAQLLAAAGKLWNVAAAECQIVDGLVTHASGKRAHFGALASTAADLPLPAQITLKDPAKLTLIGTPAPRVDVPPKVFGKARFGIDTRLPGLLFATVRTCPVIGGRLRSYDPAAALTVPGVIRVSTISGAAGSGEGVAVVATSTWAAREAAAKLAIDWDEGANATLDGARLIEAMRDALEHLDGHVFHQRGDVDAALAGAAKVIDVAYRAPWLAHATLEPMNCTAQVEFVNGQLFAEVWAPTQVASIARHVAARTLGVAADHVRVNVTLLGGGFGRRLESDYVAQAVQIARDVTAAPVQVIWSREEDMTHDMYRPAALARMRVALDAGGYPIAWVSRTVSDAITPQFAERAYPGLMGPAKDMPDKTTAEGHFDQAYEIANRRSSHLTFKSPVPIGFWRSVGHSHNAFFTETCIDEVAHAANLDPVDLRGHLLAAHPRHRAVLDLAAAKAGWGTPLAAGRARGVALHESFGSIVAQIAEVEIVDGAPRVHRVICAIDCGMVVNPGIVAQQMESGVIFGLTAALYGEITIRNGRVEQTNFPQYRMLTLAQAPAVETHIVPSQAAPGGVGEPGTPPIAPAVGNALFRLTGKRLRELPLRLG